MQALWTCYDKHAVHTDKKKKKSTEPPYILVLVQMTQTHKYKQSTILAVLTDQQNMHE